MKRSLTALAFFFLLSFTLFAQTPSQTSAPSAAPAFPQPAHGEKMRIPGIPNAGKITDSLYRGAQPREMGLSELKLLGITTIVDLRGEDREKILWERKHAESLGMRFINIPVSGWDPPTDEQVVQFLSLFRDNPGQKVFLHCRFGDDRTGVFTAVYRMAVERWPAEQATKEMYFFGFNGFWHPSMKSFVHDFPARLNSAPTLAPLRTPPSQPGSTPKFSRRVSSATGTLLPIDFSLSDALFISRYNCGSSPPSEFPFWDPPPLALSSVFS